MTDIITEITQNADQFKRTNYVAMNATFGTAIAINADPGAIAATEGTLSIHNSASRTGDSTRNTIIVPQYIRLICTVIPASGTTLLFRFANDVINRYSSGGSTLTPTETYVDTTTSFARRTSKATIKFGDLTLAAASSEKQVGQAQMHSATVSGVIGDQYLITFGDYGNSNALMSASAAQAYTHNCQKIYLGPGTSLIMQTVSASAATTAGQYYVEVGYQEIKRGDGSLA